MLTHFKSNGWRVLSRYGTYVLALLCPKFKNAFSNLHRQRKPKLTKMAIRKQRVPIALGNNTALGSIINSSAEESVFSGLTRNSSCSSQLTGLEDYEHEDVSPIFLFKLVRKLMLDMDLIRSQLQELKLINLVKDIECAHQKSVRDRPPVTVEKVQMDLDTNFEIKMMESLNRTGGALLELR